MHSGCMGVVLVVHVLYDHQRHRGSRLQIANSLVVNQDLVCQVDKGSFIGQASDVLLVKIMSFEEWLNRMIWMICYKRYQILVIVMIKWDDFK